MNRSLSRRSFLAAAGATTAVLVSDAVAGANSRIRCGIIGVGRRGTALLRLALAVRDVEIAAVCDIQPAHLERGLQLVSEAGQRRPDGYGEGDPKAYRRLLDRDDLDAVIIATPMQDHGVMSIDAVRAGKAVLSEVAAAMTMDECWGLVRAVEESGSFYMLAENVCYFRNCLTILNMVQQGLFGELIYGECGYVHDCRFLHFNKEGSLTWRGQLARDHIGNLYPTHAIGPMAQWMGINKTDRFVSLVAMDSKSYGPASNALNQYGPDSPQSQIHFKKGDTTTTLIKTANGAVIDLRYDTSSNRPHRTTIYHALQGETASYRSVTDEIWVQSRSEKYRWEPFSKYAEQFDHPLWQQWEKEAADSGHGGADFFVLKEFFDALRDGKQSPIDVYDAVTWSCIIPLSAESIRKGNASLAIPDFTRQPQLESTK